MFLCCPVILSWVLRIANGKRDRTSKPQPRRGIMDDKQESIIDHLVMLDDKNSKDLFWYKKLIKWACARTLLLELRS